MTALLRLGRLGDVVLLGSVTRALGDAVVVTSPPYQGLAARLIGVRAVCGPDDAPRDLVDLQASLRTRLRYPLAPRVRKRTLRRRLWLRVGWPRRPDVPTLYGEALGISPVGPPWIEVPARARDTLALIPGAAHALKRAPWRALVAAGQAWSGSVVVLGGPDEAEQVDALARAVGGRPIAERGFTRTLDALASVAVAVSGDTGLMHLAGATGARVVGLFGPTHPDDGFFVYPGAVVQRLLPCRPCALHRIERCRLGTQRCLDGLEAAVVEAVLGANSR